MTGGYHPVIHQAVARHAAIAPEATAIAQGRERISYAALDAAAGRYAAELAARGVGQGDVVPLLLPRSVQLVALQLGVLKCGAAYAGLDLRWPEQRLAAVLDLLAPPVLVADGYRATCPVYRPPAESVDAAAGRNPGFEPVIPDPGAPATLFFTSGTTGRPKIVVSPHQAVTRLFAPGGLAGFGPGHATPQAAPLPWDMYAFEVWGQLVSGGTTVPVPDNHLLPGSLRELTGRAGVDTLWLTTSLFNLFVDEDVDCFAGLRQVLTGGERLSPGHVRAFLDHHPGIPLRNGYGPAESCMLTTTRLLRAADCEVPGGIPVGVAVPGTTVLVLDAADRPCPAGQPGEICIAGTGLACGYFADPELTAAKFPTVQLDGAPVRIYRTGDIGCTDDTGVLHFRGRSDRQVKISGHRVEMDEIEVAVRRLDGVRDCVALPLLDPDGQVSRLALFYLADPGDAAPGAGSDPLAVDGRLRRLLPGYQVPAVIRRLDKFPVTANGKVDGAELARLARLPRRAAPLPTSRGTR
jgi:amino acid adenylation domain-containing protein